MPESQRELSSSSEAHVGLSKMLLFFNVQMTGAGNRKTDVSVTFNKAGKQPEKEQCDFRASCRT